MFNLDMAAEMAAWILSKSGGCMEKAKLNLLMYLSERDCILECFLPICHDAMICRNGIPVLEQSAAFITGGPKNDFEQRVWRRWFKPFDDEARLLCLQEEDFGEAFYDKFDFLHLFACDVLDEVCERYGGLSCSCLQSGAVCHECINRQGPLGKIAIEDLCLAHGKSQKHARDIVANIAFHREMCQAMDELVNYGR